MILVNHIGTSVISSVENELMMLVKDIMSAVDEEVILTFNSERAIRKLKDKGILINTPSSILSETNETVRILPVHLVGGRDLAKLNQLSSDHVEVLSPLLANEFDCLRLSQVILELIDPEKALILVGHGTTDKSNQLYGLLEEVMKTHHKNTTIMTLDDDVSTYKSTNKEVILMPLFTVAGHHVQRDMFSAPTSFKNQLLEMGYKVTDINKGLLSYESVRQLYIKKIDR